MNRIETRSTRFAAALTHAAIFRPFFTDLRRMAHNPDVFRQLPADAPPAPEPEPVLLALVA